MAGLVAYASSDEEDEVETTQIANASSESAPPETRSEEVSEKPKEGGSITQSEVSDSKPQIGPQPPGAAPLGPSLPPLEEEYPTIDISQAPGSPYTTNRAIIHDLTLPSVPDLDIPPSPPGSPPPGASKKFQQFLELKKKGIHFNAKLESSNSLRNPGLMDKLMGFVDIDERSQYQTTLPKDLWDPSAFPDTAFRGRLRRSQERIEKEREAEKAGGGRTAVEFVPSSTGSGASKPSAGGLSRGEKRKSGWN